MTAEAVYGELLGKHSFSKCPENVQMICFRTHVHPQGGFVSQLRCLMGPRQAAAVGQGATTKGSGVSCILMEVKVKKIILFGSVLWRCACVINLVFMAVASVPKPMI